MRAGSWRGAFNPALASLSLRDVERVEFRLDGHNLSDARDPVSESEVGDAQYYRMTARDVRVSLGVRF